MQALQADRFTDAMCVLIIIMNCVESSGATPNPGHAGEIAKRPNDRARFENSVPAGKGQISPGMLTNEQTDLLWTDIRAKCEAKIARHVLQPHFWRPASGLHSAPLSKPQQLNGCALS